VLVAVRRLVTGLGLVVLALLGWLLLAPQQLGGPVTVVSTYGDSMLPTYTASDLVVVTKASDYDVGDIVAYRSDELGAVVLHRIVDVDENGYVTQGDNNDWVDPDRPTEDELLGTARLRIPGAGRLLEVPPVVRAGAVVALAAAALVGDRTARRRRARRRPDPAAPAVKLLAPSRRRRSPRPATLEATDVASHGRFAWVGWPARTALGAAALALLALLVAAVAFTRPTTAAGDLTYTHHGEFSYTADAPRGLVYPDGRVATGDPVFLQLVDTLEVAFTHTVDGPVSITETTGQLWLEVENSTGWSTRSQLGDDETVAKGDLQLAGTLEIPQLRRTLQRFQDQTGISAGGATITLIAEVEMTGSVTDHPVSDTLAPQLKLQLDESRLTPQVEEAQPDAALSMTQAGSVTVPGLEPARMEIRRWGMDVTTARIASIAVLVVAVLALMAGVIGAARQRDLDQSERIQLRYGRRLVEVAALQLPAGYGIVDVRDMATLARLADQVERPLLHHRMGDVHTYLVEGDTAIYRYRIDAPSPHQEETTSTPPGEAQGTGAHPPFGSYEAGHSRT
jgi:signal peptidase I